MNGCFGNVDANAVAGDAGDAVDFGACFSDVGGHYDTVPIEDMLLVFVSRM